MAVAFVTAQELNTGTGTTRTMSNVQGSGGSLVIVMVAYRETAEQTITGVTYGGNAMTAIESSLGFGAGGGCMYVYYYITSANGDVVVTFSAAPGADVAQCHALVFSGTHGTSPIGTHSTSTGVSATSTSSAAVSSSADGLVVDTYFLRGSDGTLASGANQDLRSDLDEADSLLTRTSTKAGAASVTMSWTFLSSAQFGHAVIPIVPAAVTGSPNFMLLGVG